ncbi:uracil-DNA glycosylase [Methylonatrum kenyense]|uniref:uracil-DNA glycosylase n=1 Tax=Methylonatrum kenyense TaxID=455253 RepID=UPI0020BFEAFA|nr:uracil-DNA glycosylase [Methylonatrum kenyense]MCK8515797.1 uracil-DNA glycosylase [Methylonatrum kenyense]
MSDNRRTLQQAAKPFDPACRACPRLAGFLDAIAAERPDYHAAPVPDFGDSRARFLIVGLAPGMHGANRTGRPFTGDHAGILLYQTLYDFGFASAPESHSADDGLQLMDARVSNAVRCLPPQNKPTPAEVRSCSPYLRHDLEHLPEKAVVLALGRIAHDAVLAALGERRSRFAFGHAAEHRPAAGFTLLDSYHCSRYNTQTRRLTPAMFQAVFRRVRELLDQS